jgi:hypothetical protein
MKMSMKESEKISPMRGDEKMEQLVHDLTKNKDFMARIAKARDNLNPKERSIQLMEVCELFGIDWETFNYINENDPEIPTPLSGKLDMCVIGYSTEEDLYGTPLHTSLEKRLHRKAYPSVIDISRFASKKSVHEFIDSHWKDIESWRQFANGKSITKKFRPRPNAKISAFAYKNQKMDKKILLNKIREKFGKNSSFGYENLNTMITDENNLRNSDLKMKSS